MLDVDHIIIVADDLDAASHRMLEEHGLASIPGGRHTGHGTGNRIVPLGSSYIELMAVFDPDEARTSPLGRWATNHASDELEPAALCLRTDEIDAIGTALGLEPEAMSRANQDGRSLSWRLVGLAGMLESSLPFFIEWDAGGHPGADPAPHRTDPEGIVKVEIGGVPEPLLTVVSACQAVDVGSGPSGVRAVTIGTPEGDIRLPSV